MTTALKPTDTFYVAYAFWPTGAIAYSRARIRTEDKAREEATARSEIYGGGYAVVLTTYRQWQNSNTMHMVDGIVIAEIHAEPLRKIA